MCCSDSCCWSGINQHAALNSIPHFSHWKCNYNVREKLFLKNKQAILYFSCFSSSGTFLCLQILDFSQFQHFLFFLLLHLLHRAGHLADFGWVLPLSHPSLLQPWHSWSPRERIRRAVSLLPTRGSTCATPSPQLQSCNANSKGLASLWVNRARRFAVHRANRWLKAPSICT